MVTGADGSKRACDPETLVGAHIEVRMSRGRTAPRTGIVLGVRAMECISQGRVIVVRWDDDGCVSSLVPGADIEVI